MITPPSTGMPPQPMFAPPAGQPQQALPKEAVFALYKDVMGSYADFQLKKMTYEQAAGVNGDSFQLQGGEPKNNAEPNAFMPVQMPVPQGTSPTPQPSEPESDKPPVAPSPAMIPGQTAPGQVPSQAPTV